MRRSVCTSASRRHLLNIRNKRQPGGGDITGILRGSDSGTGNAPPLPGPLALPPSPRQAVILHTQLKLALLDPSVKPLSLIWLHLSTGGFPTEPLCLNECGTRPRSPGAREEEAGGCEVGWGGVGSGGHNVPPLHLIDGCSSAAPLKTRLVSLPVLMPSI